MNDFAEMSSLINLSQIKNIFPVFLMLNAVDFAVWSDRFIAKLGPELKAECSGIEGLPHPTNKPIISVS